MAPKIPSALSLEQLELPTAVEVLIKNLAEGINAKGKAWDKVPGKGQRVEKIVKLIQDLKDAISKYQDPSWSALVAFKLAAEIYDLDDEELTKTFKIGQARAAANFRHLPGKDLYTHALERVKLSLESGENPEWTHADYTNWLKNNSYYKDLPREPLKERVKELFKRLGLSGRIAKGPAKHIKLEE